MYRELFFNNIAGLLGGNFPVIRRTLDEVMDGAFGALLCRARSRTPLFPEIAREFIRFLEAREDTSGDPPWLAELAHYEWIELAVQVDDSPLPAHDPDGDLLEGVPVVSPWIRTQAYRWPVHTSGLSHRPMTPPAEPTLLLGAPATPTATHASPRSPRWCTACWSWRAPAGAAVAPACRLWLKEAGIPATDAFLAEGTAMLRRMREEGTLLGTQPP